MAKRKRRDAGDATFPDENPNRPREYHGRRTLVVGLLVVGAAAAALWLGLSGGGGGPTLVGSFGLADFPAYLNPDDQRVAVEIGALAPDFELETIDGERFRLSDWRGHPLLINFWASWCGPCRREVPVLVRLQEQHRQAGLVIIGVNIEEARGPAQNFVDEFGINYPVPMDFGGSVTRRYLQIGPPNSIFVRPDGVIASVFVGQAPDQEFEQEVAALVASLAQPLGPAPLPGPKALPTSLDHEGRAPAGRVGQPAPDFLLERADRAGATWRLSGNRGAPLVIAFAPPACRSCGAAAVATAEPAQQAGYTLVLVLDDDDARATIPPATHLQWRDDVAALFAVRLELRIVVIDAQGVVRAVEDTPDDLAAVLAALEPAQPPAQP